jgi:hypothetical protein
MVSAVCASPCPAMVFLSCGMGARWVAEDKERSCTERGTGLFLQLVLMLAVRKGLRGL